MKRIIFLHCMAVMGFIVILLPFAIQAQVNKDSMLLEQAYRQHSYSAVRAVMNKWHRQSAMESTKYPYSKKDKLVNKVYRKYLSELFAGKTGGTKCKPADYKEALYFFTQPRLQYKFIDTVSERISRLIAFTEHKYVPPGISKTAISDSIRFIYQLHDSIRLLDEILNAQYKNDYNSTPVRILKKYSTRQKGPALIYGKPSYQHSVVHFWGYMDFVSGRSTASTTHYPDRVPDDKKIDFLKAALKLPSAEYAIVHNLNGLDITADVTKIYSFPAIDRVLIFYFNGCTQYCCNVYKIERSRNQSNLSLISALYLYSV